MKNTNELRSAIEKEINKYSAENGSGTPDFILAQYLIDCLAAFDKATKARESWYRDEIYYAYRYLSTSYSNAGNGAALACELLPVSERWNRIAVNLYGLSPELLTSSFFNGFLQTIYEKDQATFNNVKKIKWLTDYDFQKEYIEFWIENFKPFKS